MSRLSEWLERKFEGNPCALPPHLRGRRHNDWALGKFIQRSWNARGPRCDGEGYLRWPPRLDEGRGVARWESAGGRSVIFIKGLEEAEVVGSQVYGRAWLAVEMNPGSPRFGKAFDVFLEDPRAHRVRVTDVYTPDGSEFGSLRVDCDPDLYSPSALQKFSMRGWMRLDPWYVSYWRVLKRREEPGRETGDDTVTFMRSGARPDHVDVYYNCGRFPFVGLKWE